MNPLVVKFILGAIRRALQSSGLLLTVSDTDLTQLIVTLGTAFGLLWGFYNDYTQQKMLVTAAATHGVTSVDHIKVLVKEGRSASATTPNDEVPERRH